MAQFAGERARRFYAETYDTLVPDWPAEMDFYRGLAAAARAQGQAVLDVACGTGRVAIPLARDGARVVGLDLSPAMLAVAREKSIGMGNLRWVQGDMRSFDLGETFGLAIIPGHSFQNILTAPDQVATLQAIKRHLLPGSPLVLHLDHQDLRWLGGLAAAPQPALEPARSFTHPRTGQPIRTLQAWTYERATQTAILRTVWEAVGQDGAVTDRWESGPLRFHCPFRTEIEHLLERTGWAIESLYGDFGRQPLRDDSSEMIWLARRP